jgi:hypothetical protein
VSLCRVKPFRMCRYKTLPCKSIVCNRSGKVGGGGGSSLTHAFGLLASALFGRSRGSSYWSYMSSSTDRRNTDRWNTEGQSAYSGNRRTKDWQNKANEAWEDIKGAVIGVAATKAGSALEEILPGFQEHYQKRQQERRSERTDRRNATLLGRRGRPRTLAAPVICGSPDLSLELWARPSLWSAQASKPQ